LAIDDLEEIVQALRPLQLRPVFMERVRHRWFEMPDRGRLQCIATFEKRKLKLAELRVVAGTIVSSAWADGADEPGLALRSTVIVRSARGGRRESQILAHVGLHGIARHFQRAWDVGEEALFRDIKSLSDWYPETVTKGGEFAIPTHEGGAWMGRVISGGEGSIPVLAVRTFR
jgi:hypothetical protein